MVAVGGLLAAAEALADPLFDDAPTLADMRLAASNTPGLVRAFLDLYRAHREGQDRLAALDEAGFPRRAEEAPHEHLWRSLGPLGVRRPPVHRRCGGHPGMRWSRPWDRRPGRPA